MQLETLLSARVDERLEFFPEFKLSLEEEGICIQARSPLFAELFSKQAYRQGSSEELLLRPWKDNSLRLFAKTSKLGKYIQPEYGLFQGRRDDGDGLLPNLLWLTHPDLGSGCKVVLREPVPLNDLEDYFTSACAALREIYVHHIRSAEFVAKLSEVFKQ